jgi:hypothetical protein
MLKHLNLYLLLTTLLWSLTVSAQDETETPPPEADNGGDEVTIKPSSKELVKEFRVNGQLYMICVNPNKGRTYCLVDADGDGNLETRKNDLAPDFLVPAWVLKRW